MIKKKTELTFFSLCNSDPEFYEINIKIKFQLSKTTERESLKPKEKKNYKWNSKLITKWRQLVYFGLNEWRTIRRRRCCRSHVSSLCVSHLIYFIFFFLGWREMNLVCHFFSGSIITAFYIVCARDCFVSPLKRCMRPNHSHRLLSSQLAVLSLFIVKKKKLNVNINCDDLNLFLNWQRRPTKRSRTSGKIVWCVVCLVYEPCQVSTSERVNETMSVCVCARIIIWQWSYTSAPKTQISSRLFIQPTKSDLFTHVLWFVLFFSPPIEWCLNLWRLTV